jgi:hypothetical protein
MLDERYFNTKVLQGDNKYEYISENLTQNVSF